MKALLTNSKLYGKLGVIAALTLLLILPLILIDGLISERQEYRDSVLENIAESSSYAQQIMGPIIVVPYSRTVKVMERDEETRQLYEKTVVHRENLYFLPESFHFDGDMTTEMRYRGIYGARLYTAVSSAKGRFSLPVNYGISENLHEYSWGEPYMLVGISDTRGIRNVPRLQLNGETLEFDAGTNDSGLNGIHAKLPHLDPTRVEELEYRFELDLLGSSRFSFVPVGRDSRISLKSDWAHPSFDGRYLPSQREIAADGFNALWQTSFFATNMEEVLQGCSRTKHSCHYPEMGVTLMDPVDQYVKSDRAIKYALLFIVLTFAGFFLFEVLKRLSIHPMQYALVGISLAMFYLLLLSLSEHIGFAWAYLLSAAACVGLIGFYMCFVLRSVLFGLAFSVGLAGLYGLLYGLLSAEDYALLMGTILLFAVLAIVMFMTRRLDWRRVDNTVE